MSPVEVNDSNSIKMIVVILSETKALLVESRRSMGFDVIGKQGILFYLLDITLRSGQGPVQVLPINTNDSDKMNSILAVGEALTYGGVSIYYTLSDN